VSPPVIDGHAHVWPDVIARRALANPSGELKRFGDGTADGLAAAMAAAGVDRSACLAVADRPERLEKANRFVGSLDRSLFIPIGTIHPDRSVEDNLAALQAADVRGIKIHPLFQGFRLDEPSLIEILDAVSGKLPIIVHVGEGGAHQSGAMCTPAMLRDLAHQLPRLDIVACHFGGYLRLDEAEELIAGLDVYLDTSWPPGLATLDRRRVRALIERHGPDRIVFASDWPMADPTAEIAAVEALGLSGTATESILGGTLARLLGVSDEDTKASARPPAP
jgi:predicted TIM-barrel fold metal-dependent hydrolase